MTSRHFSLVKYQGKRRNKNKPIKIKNKKYKQ